MIRMGMSNRHIMSLVTRKPVFWVFDQVRHKLGCTSTEDVKRLEISDLESRGIVLSMVRKTKALISCAVNAQLICVFVFAYAKSRCRFSNRRTTTTPGVIYCLYGGCLPSHWMSRMGSGNSQVLLHSLMSGKCLTL